jgi:hypothetical protein
MSETIRVRAAVKVPEGAIEAVLENLRDQHWQVFTGQLDRFDERHARRVAATAVAAVLHWQEGQLAADRRATGHLDPDVQPCVGECGRTTNGHFEDGTHGPGWYCGWCQAVPA